MLTKIFTEDFIEGLKIARVFQPYAATNDVLGSVARLFENGEDILNRLMRLNCDVAGNQFAVHHGHLPGDMQPAVGFYSTREGKMLSAGTLAAFNAISFHSFVLFLFIFNFALRRGEEESGPRVPP